MRSSGVFLRATQSLTLPPLISIGPTLPNFTLCSNCALFFWRASTRVVPRLPIRRCSARTGWTLRRPRAVWPDPVLRSCSRWYMVSSRPYPLLGCAARCPTSTAGASASAHAATTCGSTSGSACSTRAHRRGLARGRRRLRLPRRRRVAVDRLARAHRQLRRHRRWRHRRPRGLRRPGDGHAPRERHRHHGRLGLTGPTIRTAGARSGAARSTSASTR